MLARKVNLPLAYALIAGKEGVLSDTPQRVAPTEVRITGWIAERCSPGVVGADARKDLLQLFKAVMSILLYLL